MFCKVTYFNILSCYVLCCIVTQNTIRLKKGDKTTIMKIKNDLFRSKGHTKKYKEEKNNETRERKTNNKKRIHR